MTNTPNAEVLQVSAVRLGRTVSSMSFSRKAATLPSCRDCCVVLSISHKDDWAGGAERHHPRH